LTYSRIAGIGSYLPEKILTNKGMEAIVETSDEWIRERTGINKRHIAGDGERTSDLGEAAARRAVEHAGLTLDDVDLIIVATATPDLTFPATATIIQHKLGVKNGFAFDVHAVCSGFLYALATADNFHPHRPGQMCVGHWRGDVFAHSRLDGPHNMRPVRGRRRRHGPDRGRR
jgi:3-oxoacyl-[acyl-carrier-protein] synthase-3